MSIRTKERKGNKMPWILYQLKNDMKALKSSAIFFFDNFQLLFAPSGIFNSNIRVSAKHCLAVYSQPPYENLVTKIAP